ncbi:DUF1054 family protein [Lactococcus lactis]|uniref:DUF1054 family protein n=1 Tax=Lactococcus lactis TaxID=1358 RepID=UPI00071BE9A0|nr:DUF1054 family protein [Lactococcus lactis]KST41585.1 hypothetical protein APG02_11135 [Lactococcus lactis subsp. lactis bv. diacetylactis]
MFTQKSFEIFKIEGLEPRMTEIRSEIQPVFSEIGQKLLTEDFVISKDHTKAETYPLSAFREAAERLGKVKKSELKIGRLWPKERFNGKEDSIILAEMIETIDQLLPIYQKLMEV